MFGSAAIVVAGHRNLFLHRIKISEKKFFFFGPRVHPLRAEPTMADDVFYLFFFKVSKNDPS